jgi:ribose transport system substrate-binding protein
LHQTWRHPNGVAHYFDSEYAAKLIKPTTRPVTPKRLTGKNAQDAIARGVAGIVISPTDSSTCPSVLALAQKANIPVVIGDIGTNEGEYVSFIISDNREGANGVGKALVAAMKEKGMADGTVGLVTISLTRNNGKKRTAGFRAALEEGGIKECAHRRGDGR